MAASLSEFGTLSPRMYAYPAAVTYHVKKRKLTHEAETTALVRFLIFVCLRTLFGCDCCLVITSGMPTRKTSMLI